MKQTSAAKAARTRVHPAPKTTQSGRADKPAAEALGAAPDPAQREEMVRLLAYRYYEERGCTDGHDVEDWLKAAVEVDRGFAPLRGH
jgi:hypothetical protein